MQAVRSFTALFCTALFLTVAAQAQRNPSAEQILQAGRSALQQQHYAEAIRLLEDGLKDFPNDRQLKLELGRAYLYNRQDDRAMQLFREVLREEPSNRMAKLQLARALGYHRDYKTSNQLYRELLASNPDDEAAALGLIRNLMHQKRPAEARRELERALARHPDSKRLQEYKQRLDKAGVKDGGRQRRSREPRPTATRKLGRLQGAGAYFSDSAGNRSLRSTQGFDSEITHALTTRFRVEERSLWENSGPRANVFWGTGELRLRLTRSLLLSGGGGGVRFADGTGRALYRGELELHPARRLWLTGGFSRRPISPTFRAAQLDLLAEGWRTGLEWYPRTWRITANWSREHYSDGNLGQRLNTELLHWTGDPRLAFGAGYRFSYLAFLQSPLHGYFDPNPYYSHLGVAGIKFRRGKSFRGEYTAGLGAESVSAGPYHVAWELAFRNRMPLGNWELGADYFYFHLAQSTGAFKSQGARLAVAYTF